jgi:hypothetical protein
MDSVDVYGINGISTINDSEKKTVILVLKQKKNDFKIGIIMW